MLLKSTLSYGYTASKDIVGMYNRYKDLVTAWALFLLNPFATALLAFLNYRKAYAKNIIWLFVAYYGFTLVVSNEGMDANRYRDFFISLSYTDFDFQNIGDLLYQEGSSFLDPAQLVISFLVSRFTSDPRFLFAVFGLVFGYFYSRNVWFLLERTGTEMKKSAVIYLAVFVIVLGFWKISGFRMWTAAHIFFFGAFQYFMDNKKSGILIAAVSIFFHFSYMFPFALLLAYIVLPKKSSLFFGLFIFAFFVSEIEVSVFSEILTRILPDVFHQRIQGYTSEAYLESVEAGIETRNWRFLLYRQSIKWTSTVFLTVIYFTGKKFLQENKSYYILFCFALFLMASVNVFSHIPAMIRYYPVTYLFVFALIYLYLQHAPDFHLKKLLLLIAFPFLLFYCVGQINISLMTIGMITVMGNPFVALLSQSDLDQAIIELLR